MTTGVISAAPADDDDELGGCAEARFRAWFLAEWRDALFVHYSISPRVLQPHVPFELDLFEGDAWVSLVAFTQRRLRPAVGGALAAWAMAPVASHPFLNLRTYVRGGDGVTGICFLAEWIPNRLARAVGPLLYGLPFRLGRLKYGAGARRVEAGGRAWQVEVMEGSSAVVTARPGTLDYFLVERYVAFTARDGRGCRFRIRHEPWGFSGIGVRTVHESLIRGAAPWFDGAKARAAHYSEGVADVRIGGPHRVPTRRRRSQLAPTGCVLVGAAAPAA